MYFRNYELRKRWLDKCQKKSRFTGPFNKQHGKSPNNIEIWTTAPLPYLFINVKVIALEKVSFNDIQNLNTVC